MRKRVLCHMRTTNHTCHKLWTEICEIRQIFKGDLINFCDIFTKITLERPQNSQKPLFKCKKLVINTTKCDLCLFLHKMCCKMVWKFCEIWKILWKLASWWAKFCEILSHSVRYGMYDKGADQPAHPCSLISTFVVRCLDSIMPIVSISEISRL